MGENGYLAFLSKKGVMKRILANEDRLELQSLLRLVIVLNPVLEGDRLMQATLRALQHTNPPYSQEELPLLSSALVLLMRQLPASPVYTYQLLSYRHSSTSVLQELCHSLAFALAKSTTKALPGLLAYTASSLCKQCPKVDWTTAPRDTASDYFRTLYRHYKSLPKPGDLALAMLTQVTTVSPTFKDLFYASKLLLLPGFKSIRGFKSSFLPSFLAYFSSAQEHSDWEYSLATISVLSSLQTDPTLLHFPLHHSISRLNLRSLYGEVLIWCLKYLGNDEKWDQLVLEAIPNLAYVNSEETISPETSRDLLTTLAKLRKRRVFNANPLLNTVKNCVNLMDWVTIQACYPVLAEMTEALPGELDRKVSVMGQEMNSFEVNLLSKVEKSRRLRVYDTDLIHEVLENVSPEPMKRLQLLYSLLSYLSITGNASEFLAPIHKLLGKIPALPLIPLTNLLFIHLETPGSLPPSYITRFQTVISELPPSEINQLVLFEDSGMEGFLPFPHTTQLEERKVGSNEKEKYTGATIGREILSVEWEEVWWKANGVLNAFHLSKPTEVRLALEQLVTSRAASNLWFCVNGFKGSAVENLHAEVEMFYPDPSTGWAIDVAFPSISLAIVFQGESDLIKTPDKKEICSSLLSKIWKEQLKSVGWTVVGIKKQVWMQMSQEDRDTLVQRIRTKHS